MINKELKRLSRRELVDVIYQLKKNEEEAQEELQQKRMHLSNAGSIAEASVSITNLFATAQETADLYLSEIEQMKEDTKTACAKMIEEAQQKVSDLNAQYRVEYQKLQQLRAELQALEQSKPQNE